MNHFWQADKNEPNLILYWPTEVKLAVWIQAALSNTNFQDKGKANENVVEK